MDTLEHAIIDEARRRGYRRPFFTPNGALAHRPAWWKTAYVPHEEARNITHTVIRDATVPE